MRKDRFCPNCKVIWDKEILTPNCPQCRVTSFFTMNSSDIGAAMYLNDTNQKLSDYTEIKKKPPEES